VSRRLKVGIYGGTFDPPHFAHLKLAGFALKELSLSALYIVPAKGHALKKNDRITPPEIRFEMVRTAFEGMKNIFVSRIELNGPDTSYTIDTIGRFEKYEGLQNTEIYFLIGADNIQDIHLWKEPERILSAANLVIFRRPGYSDFLESDSGHRVLYLDSPEIDISSTEIRRRILEGLDVSSLVPGSVLQLIRKYGLYTTPRT